MDFEKISDLYVIASDNLRFMRVKDGVRTVNIRLGRTELFVSSERTDIEIFDLMVKSLRMKVESDFNHSYSTRTGRWIEYPGYYKFGRVAGRLSIDFLLALRTGSDWLQCFVLIRGILIGVVLHLLNVSFIGA